jgi:hypothetical protein
MATNKELQEWLKQFPDDANIEVITTTEMGGWEGGSLVFESNLELGDVDLEEFYSFSATPTFELEGFRGVDDKIYITTIRLGRKE